MNQIKKKEQLVFMKNPVIISTLNMKGGVGKTTITCNLAIELANIGYKILVVDVDPQFNSTQTLTKYFYSNLDTYFKWQKENKTLKSIFSSPEENTGVSGNLPRNKKPIVTLKKNNISIDLIPGDLRLIVDINSTSSDKFRAFFKKDNLKNNYDFILIDCPPTWGELTSVALSISNYFIIPTNLDEFSTIGVKILTDQLSTKIDARDTPLKCLGIVYMFLATTTAKNGIKKDQLRFKNELDSYRNDEMQKKLGLPIKVFSTYFYRENRLITTSAIYRGVNNRQGEEYMHKMIDLTNEIISLVKI